MNRINFHHHWCTEVFIIQEESRKGLIGAGNRILRYLSANPALELRDLAYSMNCPVGESRYRLAIVADSLDDLGKKLDYAVQRLEDPSCMKIKDRSGIYFFKEPLGREGSLAFLFPGEGSQYLNMLSDLCIHFAEVRSCFDIADRIFSEEKRKILPSQLLFLPQTSQDHQYNEKLWEQSLAVASVFTADYALMMLLDCLEIRPQAVVGHSSGEFTALIASGAMKVQDSDEQVQLGRDLIRLYTSLEEPTFHTKLMTVGIAKPEIIASIVEKSNEKLYVAMDNCPHQVILCGHEETIDRAHDQLRDKGAICDLLPYYRPYHSPLYRMVSDQFFQFFNSQNIVSPDTTLYSCVTAQPYPSEPSAIRQLAVDQWSRPVRFRETIETMYDAGVRIFVEVGPRGNLTSFVEDILGKRRFLAVPSNLTNRSAITQINHMVGLLAANGVGMRLDYLYEQRGSIRVSFDKDPESAEKLVKSPGPIKLTPELPKLYLREDSRLKIFTKPGLHPSALAVEGSRDVPTPGKKETSVGREKVSSDSRAELKIPHRDTSRSRVMQEYLNTMGRFLQIQQEFVVASMKKRCVRGYKTYAGEPEDKIKSIRENHVEDQERPVSGGPFNITLVTMNPGKEIVVRCLLDMNEHLFLRHHTLGGSPSAIDSSLTALPAVPLTFSVEIMAQIASHLFPGKRLMEVKDVRPHRWILLEKETCTLLVSARKSGPQEAEVRISRLDEKKEMGPGFDKGLLLIEGSVVFSNEYAGKQSVADFSLTSERTYRFSPEMFYRELMFHGPTFQGVVSMDRLGEDGSEATLKIPAGAQLFRSHKEPELLTNPVLLDLANQVVGFWAQDYLESWSFAFLILTGFDHLYLYESWPPKDELVKCFSRNSIFPPNRIHSDIDVVNTDGQLIARFTGVRYAHFIDWTRQFSRFVLHPCEAMLSTSWSSPIAHISPSSGFQCCRIYESGSDIWFQVIAHIILSRREREIWSCFTGAEKRRREWLLGRLAAKDAVRLFLRERYQLKACPADIEIASDEYGRSVIEGEIIGNLGINLSLSIAHSGGGAVALVAEAVDGQGVGIDVKSIGQNHQETEALALSSAERKLLLNIPASAMEEWLLRFWCAKEAVAKALGRGMPGNLRHLIIKDLQLNTGSVSVRVAGELIRQLRDRADKLPAAYTGCEGNLVFATALV